MSIECIGIFIRNASAKSFFGKVCTLLKIAADSDTENNGRTRISACGSDTRKNIFNNVLPASCRRHHFKTAHIFAAEALGRNGDFHFIAVNDMCVNNGRRVVLGVDTSERIADNGTAQIAVHISVVHALVNSIVKTASDEMNILSYIKENDSHSGVLTDRNIKLLSRIEIFLNISENTLCKQIAFTGTAFTYRVRKIARQNFIRFYAKLFNSLAYSLNIYFSQFYHLYVSLFRL